MEGRHKSRYWLVLSALALGILWTGVGWAEPLAVTVRAVRVQPLDPGGEEGPPGPWLVQGETGARSIASLSKLTALMVVLDHGLDMEGRTTMIQSDHSHTRTGARSRLRVGFSYRNRDLVTAALMSSDNRAVLALGRAVGLSRKRLAAEMVKKARAIGLQRVHFDEPTGLSYGNVSSAEGVLLTLRAALEYEVIRDVTSRPETVLAPADRDGPREYYVNTNRLVRWGGYDVLGGKTGFNREAGFCLTFAMQVEGQRVGVALLGARTRDLLFRDAKRVARWVRTEARRRRRAER